MIPTSIHSGPPMDHSARLAGPVVLAVSAAVHTLQVHSDSCPVKSDYSPHSDSAAVQAVVVVARSLAVGYSVVRHPTAVAVDVVGVADPTVDAVAAVEVGVRRTVGAREAKPGCIASAGRDCTTTCAMVEIAAVHQTIGTIRAVVVGAVDIHYSTGLHRMTAAETCTAVGQGQSSLGSEE